MNYAARRAGEAVREAGLAHAAGPEQGEDATGLEQARASSRSRSRPTSAVVSVGRPSRPRAPGPFAAASGTAGGTQAELVALLEDRGFSA